MNINYINKFKDLDLFQSNDATTRGDSLLDLFFTNRPSLQNWTCTNPAPWRPWYHHDGQQHLSYQSKAPTTCCTHVEKSRHPWAKKKDLEDFAKELKDIDNEDSLEETGCFFWRVAKQANLAYRATLPFFSQAK